MDPETVAPQRSDARRPYPLQSSGSAGERAGLRTGLRQGAAEAGPYMPGAGILPGAAAVDLSAAGLRYTESLPAI